MGYPVYDGSIQVLALLRPGRLAFTVAFTVALAAIAFLVLAPGNLPAADTAAEQAPSAPRVEQRRILSASLGREMPFQVYLPPGYDSNQAERYPVLYMLHGLGGNERDWERLGLFATATSLIQAGDIQPLIIVTPAGESGYWVDHAGNGPRFGTYVARDLVETIDAEYRTHAARSARAIGGMSMGGHGALQLALNNPGEFSIVGAHSVALRRYEQAFPYYGNRRYFESNDPVSICEKYATLARNFTIWLDIGRDDVWFPGAKAFEAQLSNQGIPHEWHPQDGGHDAAYWSAHLGDYLHFYARAFAQLDTSPVALAQH